MFIGRKKEIDAIKVILESDTPGIVVIYGRRRIGKSELIKQCVKGISVLNFEGAEGQSQKKQIKNFQDQFDFQIGASFRKSNPSSWKEILLELVKELRVNPRPVIIDEFQWMANYRSELGSELKVIWDQYLKTLKGVSLVLCGSIASFMITKVLRSKALFGRINCTIHLKPFALQETKLMFPGKGYHEILEAQCLTSGVPLYLQQLSEADSVRLSLAKLAFHSSGLWVSEYQKIFVSHFGKTALYRQIVEILSQYSYGLFRTQLLEKLGEKPGGRFSDLLFDLEKAGFISSYTPLNKSVNSKLKKYMITDSFIHFYLNFIKPNMKTIQDEISDNLFQNIMHSNAYISWLGTSFEKVCILHTRKIALLLGFSGIEYSAGAYFKRYRKNEKEVQIDLLYQRKDNVITLCEMKYSQNPIGLGITMEVRKKEEMLEKNFPGKTIQRVLITLSPPTKELIGAGYFWKIIRAEELLT